MIFCPKKNISKLIKAWDMDEELMMLWLCFLYEHHDGFVLPIKCTEGFLQRPFLQLCFLNEFRIFADAILRTRFIKIFLYGFLFQFCRDFL